MAVNEKMRRPGYSFLVCPDSGLILRQVESLLADWAPPGKQWQKRVYWGDEPPPDGFWEDLRQQGLFAAHRAVIARHADKWPAATWKSLSATLAKGHDDVWPIFCLEGNKMGQSVVPAHILKIRCFDYANKQKWVWTREPLAGAQIRIYAEEQAKKSGICLDREAMDIFCASVRSDASAIDNELQKLALSSVDGKISADMISRDSNAPENNAFVCVNKLFAGDLVGVWNEISRSSDSSLLFFLIALLAKELRLLWQIQTGDKPRLHPSVAAQKRACAKRIGHAGIARGFAALADAEWQVKSGRQTPEQTLEKLVVSLCDLFALR